jgi:hypothetical protein
LCLRCPSAVSACSRPRWACWCDSPPARLPTCVVVSICAGGVPRQPGSCGHLRWLCPAQRGLGWARRGNEWGCGVNVRGIPGIVGKGSLWFPPLGSETRCLYVLPSAPLLISPSGCGGEIRSGADGSARRADAGGRGAGRVVGAHSGRTACRGLVRVLCGWCAGGRGVACLAVGHVALEGGRG